MNYDGLDLRAWDVISCALSLSAERAGHKATAISSATLLGGFTAACEDAGMEINLDEIRSRIQEGYDDYFKRKREGELGDLGAGRVK